MRVILNSDVLYGDFSSNGLPVALIRLGEACAEQGHVLVIPTTTLMEIERHQREIVAGQRKLVESARQTLADQGITVPEFKASDVVPDVDVGALLTDLAAEIQVESPSLEDFEDAHTRACLHESPHPPDIKSDEMRDLVIWAVSLRLSAQDGHALLVSKDTVHTHGRGDTEAASVNLARVESLDAALEYLDVLLRAGDAQLLFTGVAMDLLNLRPEICTLLVIQTPEWFEQARQARLNDEFLPETAAGGFHGWVRLASDEDMIQEAGLLPERMIPPGAAAFWMGVDLLRERT